MSRITLRLDDELMTLLQTQADEKVMAISQYLRYLIKLALKVEQLSAKRAGNQATQSSLDELEKAAQIAIFETALLVKNLFLLASKETDADKKAFLKKISKNAEQYVEKYHME